MPQFPDLKLLLLLHPSRLPLPLPRFPSPLQVPRPISPEAQLLPHRTLLLRPKAQKTHRRRPRRRPQVPACIRRQTATSSSLHPAAAQAPEPFSMSGLIRARIHPIHPPLHLNRQQLLPPPISLHLPQRQLIHPSFKARSVRPLAPMAASLKPQICQFDNTVPSEDVLGIWCSADAVCFDVDSTVCLDEGIDELADFCGAGQAVAEWTARAMSGSVPFEEALAARLSLFNPSLAQVEEFLAKSPPRISPGIAELITKLKANGTNVYLISGGFRQMINPVASQLGIPRENIFANQLLFGSSNEFVGFDTTEPTSRSGGKATAVQHIRKICEYKTMVMIGDGATDLEARKPGGADIFICYAGVQLRGAVAAQADWVVFDFQELITSLP